MNVDFSRKSGRFFTYRICEIIMILHTHIKQIALIVVTIINACSGTSLLNNAPIETTTVDTSSARLGTDFLLSLASFAGASLFLLNVYRLRLVEYESESY